MSPDTDRVDGDEAFLEVDAATGIDTGARVSARTARKERKDNGRTRCARTSIAARIASMWRCFPTTGRRACCSRMRCRQPSSRNGKAGVIGSPYEADSVRPPVNDRAERPMLLTVECLDQETLRWRMLARHEGVAPESAPMIVGVLRDGLPPSSVLRWNWSDQRRQPVAPGAIARGRRAFRKGH